MVPNPDLPVDIMYTIFIQGFNLNTVYRFLDMRVSVKSVKFLMLARFLLISYGSFAYRMKSILRKKIINRFDHLVNNPKDCEQLSEVIYEQTGRTISPTTLRRFFGLLRSKSSLSRFNLDTLSIYCGSEDFQTFQQENGEDNSRTSVDHQTVVNEMALISKATLNSIGRKSLTKFSQTIPRISINERINGFLDSEFSVLPLIAPGGYGKSIALAHWVHKKLGESSPAQNILFCPASLFHQPVSRRFSLAKYRGLP